MRIKTYSGDSALVSPIIRRSQILFWLAVAAFFVIQGSRAAFARSIGDAWGTVAVDAYDNLAATADRSGLVRLFDLSVPDRPAQISELT
jgi:hypothetical protein